MNKKYFLFSKTETENNNCAKLIRDCTLTPEKFQSSCDSKYEKMFQEYDKGSEELVSIYSPESHYVHYGTPLKLPKWDGKEIREKTTEEGKIDGNIPLVDGEKIEAGKLVVVPSPGDGYKWHEGAWITERQYGIDTGSITLDSEKEAARVQREKEYTAYHKFTNNLFMGVEDPITPQIEEEIQVWHQAWKDVPNNYTDVTITITESYPTRPEKFNYYQD
ncbi:hypothetical protein PM10SUCC1_32240 [Propionigenium maris DSM 9537]|uniref:Uncharacterized protein n=1 Tax=Propionigenium maris DSM 9537 TaxID=1123000 RepID=A0A9W6LQ08_9FUSO|nr:hypothetical protein [Propionigenium maris]GLI57710.1 hypothetical protein PM10SUCC1_32240 [Propionigenium maris DSM 9537]